MQFLVDGERRCSALSQLSGIQSEYTMDSWAILLALPDAKFRIVIKYIQSAH